MRKQIMFLIIGMILISSTFAFTEINLFSKLTATDLANADDKKIEDVSLKMDCSAKWCPSDLTINQDKVIRTLPKIYVGNYKKEAMGNGWKVTKLTEEEKEKKAEERALEIIKMILGKKK